jgi:hypothetical protein
MKKLSLFFLFTFFAFTYLSAEIINEQTAITVAKNHFYVVTGTDNYTDLELVFTKSNNDQPVYYIFNAKENLGFIIISADDNVYPVLGYSFEQIYFDHPDAANFHYWMNNYADQIIYVRENNVKADEKITSSWNELLKTNPSSKDLEEVDPLLSTNWDQGTYYNQFCPADPSGPGGHVWAGCVATAMGMVMKYHDYPEQGTGSHSYNASGYGTQSANFGETTYEWDNMPNQLYSNNTPVATLLYHLGVSVDMQYSPSGSGAFSADARDALVEYFNYSENAALLPKNSFPIETFIYKIKNELNLNRPLYYSGSSNSGGHAFVCDGYQGDSHFHFNFGWSGYGNGYYYLSNVNGFNSGQAALFYVYPEGTDVLAGAENFTAEIVDEDVHLNWDAPSGSTPMGYNVYKNNTILELITETSYVDEGLEQGSYTYYVCAVYDEGESFPTEAVSVFFGGGTTTIAEDNFEAYESGGQLACQNEDDWTTWSDNPCSSEDAYITSEVTYEGSNSTIIEGSNDVVRLIDNYTEGLYRISFQMFVPSGFLGYFNTLQLFNGTNSEWGMQVFFNDDGTASIDGGGEGAATFSYPNDTWMLQEVIVDLNNDWAEYKLDGVSIHGWQWSIGSFGQSNLNQLGAINLFAWTGSDKGTPKFYVDNFMIEEFGELLLMPPVNFTLSVTFDNIQLSWEEPAGNTLNGYNIYYAYDGGDFNLLTNTTETSYIVESPGYGMHAYYLTAVYEEGESDPTNIEEVTLTGIEDNESIEVEIFPNPAEDYMAVIVTGTVISMKIYGYDGNLIGNPTSSGNRKLDISQLESGVYFLQVETENSNFTKRFIKK